MSDTQPMYQTEVQLSGEDGNAYAIMGRVSGALRRDGADQLAIDQFKEEAMSGDYNNLISVCRKWVSVL